MKHYSLTWLGLLFVPVLLYAVVSACGGGSSNPQDGASAGSGGKGGTAGVSGGAGAGGYVAGGSNGSIDAAPYVTACSDNPCDTAYPRCIPVYGGTGCAVSCPGYACPTGKEPWCDRFGGQHCVDPQ